jgi:protein-tyrosine phosphatase
LSQLTLGGSEYLLLELSDQRLPAHLYQIADQLLMMGITPVLAHVERCTYFREEPERLLKLAEFGVLTQVSAAALQDKKDRGFAKACLQNGLAQVIASDAHNLADRAPCLSGVPEQLMAQAERMARTIWKHQMAPDVACGPIRKTLFGYK